MFDAMRPPLWHRAQVLMPMYVPAVIVWVTLVLPLTDVWMTSLTVYCPRMSGRSIVRPATLNTGAPELLTRSATLNVGTLVPSGLGSSAAVDPSGLSIKVHETLVMVAFHTS